ncbi:MAG TPA: STAS domain-containing protein [Natronosporangium sp.]
MVSVETERDGDVLTLSVSGEVDLATSPVVDDAITEAIVTSGANTVSVDLSAVEFLDSSGIALLLKGRRRADERGVAYRVTGAQGTPLQVLRIAGVWGHLSGETDPSGQSVRP